METLYLTGSSGGLGREVRSYFMERGWNVVGFDAFDDEFQHAQFFFQKIDSTSEDSVAKAFGEAVKKFGAPRTLFATIGGLKPWTDLEEISENDFHFILDLNVTATFICVKQAVKLMKPLRKGTIITVGADTALHAEPKKTIYIAAKAAVIAMTESLAEETKAYGVNTNCIAPRVIHTKANESWGSPEEIPTWTEPKDIAAMCMFLSSDEGAAINGALIRIPNKA